MYQTNDEINKINKELELLLSEKKLKYVIDNLLNLKEQVFTIIDKDIYFSSDNDNEIKKIILNGLNNIYNNYSNLIFDDFKVILTIENYDDCNDYDYDEDDFIHSIIFGKNVINYDKNIFDGCLTSTDFKKMLFKVFFLDSNQMTNDDYSEIYSNKCFNSWKCKDFIYSSKKLESLINPLYSYYFCINILIFYNFNNLYSYVKNKTLNFTIKY